MLSSHWYNHPNIWFNSSTPNDEFLVAKYGNFDTQVSEFNSILDLSQVQDINILHNFILIFDQISRHARRINKIDEITFTNVNKLALHIAEYLIDSKKIYQFDNENKIYFTLMPLRHTFQSNYLKRVILILKQLDLNSTGMRFFKNTLISYSKIITDTLEPEPMKYILSDSTRDEINILLDKNSSSIPFYYTNLNMTDQSYSNRNFDNTLSKFPSVMKQIPQNVNVIVSLSGGVDSMVLLYLAKRYLKNNIIAVHISYNNRDESDYERNFVKHYCSVLQVPLYIRNIWEIKRSQDKYRDLYESITQTFRFDLYKKFDNAVVLLGHNKDDCFENVITNTLKSRSLNNLKGMTFEVEKNGCIILRPFLEIYKKDIYEFANYVKIPYLYDSTPDWSCRGRIRDNIVPVFNDFDPNLINRFLELSNTYSDIYTIFDDIILNVYNIRIFNIRFDLDEITHYPSIFWKKIIEIYLKKNNFSNIMVSNNSIQNFTDKINRRKYSKINLTKDFICEYKLEKGILDIKKPVLIFPKKIIFKN